MNRGPYGAEERTRLGSVRRGSPDPTADVRRDSPASGRGPAGTRRVAAADVRRGSPGTRRVAAADVRRGSPDPAAGPTVGLPLRLEAGDLSVSSSSKVRRPLPQLGRRPCHNLVGDLCHNLVGEVATTWSVAWRI